VASGNVLRRGYGVHTFKAATQFRSLRARAAAGLGASLSRPASATHAGVAASGVVAMLSAVSILNVWRPVHPIAYLALIVMACAALGVIVPDLLWQKVHRRVLVAAAAPGNWQRSLTKLVGLVGAVGFVAALYWLFPEYHNGKAFYGNCVVALEVVLPIWALCAAPYLYWIDRRVAEPQDGLWHMGRLVTLQWSGLDFQKAFQYQLGWLVKGFFLPLMFTYFCTELDKLLNYNVHLLVTFKGFYEWAYFTLYFIDVAWVSMTYILSLKVCDTHIRSTEPTMAGWVAALLCYQPFWSLVSDHYIDYSGSKMWGDVFNGSPWLGTLWGGVILALVAVYVWATISFGARFSNLTHRGIITNGPYRYSKHPAYLAKNLSWWLISMPFLATDDLGMTLRRCALLALLNAVYFMRAKTEERHLAADPVYVQYSDWMTRHGLLRWFSPVGSRLFR